MEKVACVGQTWGQKALSLAKAQREKGTKEKSERPLLFGRCMSRIGGV